MTHRLPKMCVCVCVIVREREVKANVFAYERGGERSGVLQENIYSGKRTYAAVGSQMQNWGKQRVPFYSLSLFFCQIRFG